MIHLITTHWFAALSVAVFIVALIALFAVSLLMVAGKSDEWIENNFDGSHQTKDGAPVGDSVSFGSLKSPHAEVGLPSLQSEIAIQERTNALAWLVFHVVAVYSAASGSVKRMAARL